MLVQTERTLASRCASCGHLRTRLVSLFALSKGSKHNVECECGFQKAVFTRQGRFVHIQYACVACQGTHHKRISVQALCRSDLEPLTCSECHLVVGYVGIEMSVRSALSHQDTLENLVLDPECANYFENPRVMYGTLEALQAMAEVGRLNCSCGNDALELDIYPTKVDLLCTGCGSRTTICAETDEDLARTTGLRNVTLSAVRSDEAVKYKGFFT